MTERKLGRGLDFLIKRTSTVGNEPPTVVRKEQVPVSRVQPNPFQPRRVFDDLQLQDLAESIRIHGVLQPISVRQLDDGFQLIAGERRWRACQNLGLEFVPAVIHTANDQQMLEWALIENIQREDLDPIEKARAYRRLVDEFSLTQESAAEHLAQKRSTVANYLRLLDLPESIRALVSNGAVSMGHARTLLGVDDPKEQQRLADLIREGRLTVRQLEALVQERRSAVSSDGSRKRKSLSTHLDDVQSRFREALRTRVQIRGHDTKGKIVIEYYDVATLNRILEIVEKPGTPMHDSKIDEPGAPAIEEFGI